MNLNADVETRCREFAASNCRNSSTLAATLGYGIFSADASARLPQGKK